MLKIVHYEIEHPFQPPVFGQNFDIIVPDNVYWKIIEANPLKITAISKKQKLFAKAFAPILSNYCKRVEKAFQALTDLNLEVPILAPIAIINGIFYFVEAENCWHDAAASIYSPAEKSRIIKAIESHRLKSTFSDFDRAETAYVKGKQFLIDPIDDSGLSNDTNS